jgi:hypothetical protein
MIDILNQGTRLECPKNCPKEMYQLMRQCWKEKPSDRPNFSEIELFLHGILNAERERQSRRAEEEARQTYQTIQQSNPGYLQMTSVSESSSHPYAMLIHASSFPDILEDSDP